MSVECRGISEQATPGGEAQISYAVTNNGSSFQSVEIQAVRGSTLAATEEVSVGPGTTLTGNLTLLVPDAPGEYEYTLQLA